MTIESTKIKEVYEGNGTTRRFPIPFGYSKAEDIYLLFTDVHNVKRAVTSDFKVETTGFGDTSVIYPVMADPIPIGTLLTVYRSTPQSQIVDLVNEGNFNLDVVEKDALDRIVMMIQEMQEELDRAVKSGITSTEPGLSVEDLYARLEGLFRKAENTLHEIENLVHPMILAKGITNLRETWVTSKPLKSGDLLRLPVGYFPKRNMLLLMMDGFACYPVSAFIDPAIPQYEEAGSEDELSRDVRLLFDTPSGAVWSVWSIASNVSQYQEELFTATEEAKNQAEDAAKKAQDALVKAEDTVANVAEVAAEEAAERAAAKAEKVLSALVQAGDLAKQLAITARDEAVFAANTVANDAQELMNSIVSIKVNIDEASVLIKQVLAHSGTLTEQVGMDAQKAVDAATRAENAAQSVVSDAIAQSIKQIETQFESYVEEVKGLVAEAKTAVAIEIMHSVAGSRKVDIMAGNDFNVPAYLVGAKSLHLYLDGFYCMSGEDSSLYQYAERGKEGATSNIIAWHDDISTMHDITAIVSIGKKEG